MNVYIYIISKDDNDRRNVNLIYLIKYLQYPAATNDSRSMAVIKFTETLYNGIFLASTYLGFSILCSSRNRK